jgi:hypothetical protein
LLPQKDFFVLSFRNTQKQNALRHISQLHFFSRSLWCLPTPRVGLQKIQPTATESYPGFGWFDEIVSSEIKEFS